MLSMHSKMMSETNPSNTPSLFGEAFRAELREIVKEAIEASIGQNGQTPELLSAETASTRWDIPVSWIRDMARRGELPHVKLGHYTRFKPDDLARFIQERKKEPSHPLSRNPASVKKSA